MRLQNELMTNQLTNANAIKTAMAPQLKRLSHDFNLISFIEDGSNR